MVIEGSKPVEKSRVHIVTWETEKKTKDKFFFAVRGANNRTILTSEGYRSEVARAEAIALLVASGLVVLVRARGS